MTSLALPSLILLAYSVALVAGALSLRAWIRQYDVHSWRDWYVVMLGSLLAELMLVFIEGIQQVRDMYLL